MSFSSRKINIEMICRKAGVGRGTIYRYFKNKEAFFAEILEEQLEEMNPQMIDGQETNELLFDSRAEIVDAYVKSVEQILTFLCAEREFARIALEVSTGVSKRFTQIRRDYDRKNISLIQTMMDQGSAMALSDRIWISFQEDDLAGDAQVVRHGCPDLQDPVPGRTGCRGRTPQGTLKNTMGRRSGRFTSA